MGPSAARANPPLVPASKSPNELQEDQKVKLATKVMMDGKGFVNQVSDLKEPPKKVPPIRGVKPNVQMISADEIPSADNQGHEGGDEVRGKSTICDLCVIGLMDL